MSYSKPEFTNLFNCIRNPNPSEMSLWHFELFPTCCMWICAFYPVIEDGSDKNWTKISLTLRNSFIPLEKTDSANVEAVEMNQTEAFQQEIELVSVLWLFFPVLFLHKFIYALIHLFVHSFIYSLFVFWFGLRFSLDIIVVVVVAAVKISLWLTLYSI